MAAPDDKNSVPFSFPKTNEAQVLAHIHPSPPWFTCGARPVINGTAPPGTASGTAPRPARRPEALLVVLALLARPEKALCPVKVLPLPGWRRAPPRRALPLLRRSYDLMRQTKTLPPPPVVTLVGGSLQVFHRPPYTDPPPPPRPPPNCNGIRLSRKRGAGAGRQAAGDGLALESAAIGGIPSRLSATLNRYGSVF